MTPDGRATRIHLLDFHTRPMRAFHMAWSSFFVCFFSWFGVAPLMSVVRAEMHFTKAQVGWCIIGSVAITVVARMAIGRLCDRFGPRRTFAWLLVLGSLPVMGIGLAHNFAAFLFFRVLIGAIGASFVITQYHTSVMFAPNCIGMATATTAGWGNLGGGVTQIVMPLVFSFFAVTLGLGDSAGWRLAMLAAGCACLLMGVAYYRLTSDTPTGDLRKNKDADEPAASPARSGLLAAARDRRVWLLFVAYAACFGVELTMDNIAALYFADTFGLGLRAAGLAAGSLGLLHIFARTLGGALSDCIGGRAGLNGRVNWLFLVLLAEGAALLFFSRMTALAWAIPAMLLFGLFMKMAEGATYAVVPFINRQALGSVAGIVGAGGNAGAVAAGFLFQGALSWSSALAILGGVVAAASCLVLIVRFSPEAEREALHDFTAAAEAAAAALAPKGRRPGLAGSSS